MPEAYRGRMAIFADRADAGRELAESLVRWRDSDAVIFGIPRGGVVVAAETARILRLPVDVAEEHRRSAFPRSSGSVAGRTVIVIDDGIATGATASAACAALRAEEPAELVLAVPVAPLDWSPDPEVVNEYVCPHRVRDFWAVGQFYEDFTQTTDAEVTRLLSRDLRAG
jgi:putative phosphoribosyl transferase